jgi:hypothetical protein
MNEQEKEEWAQGTLAQFAADSFPVNQLLAIIARKYCNGLIEVSPEDLDTYGLAMANVSLMHPIAPDSLYSLIIGESDAIKVWIEQTTDHDALAEANQ